MTFTSKSALLLCNFLHLFEDIAPWLKLVLSDPLAPLESRMTNDSNFKSDLSTSDLTATWEDARENVFYSREERRS